ncbi:unnamed protein product, partial [Leptidea sinapis]
SGLDQDQGFNGPQNGGQPTFGPGNALRGNPAYYPGSGPVTGSGSGLYDGFQPIDCSALSGLPSRPGVVLPVISTSSDGVQVSVVKPPSDPTKATKGRLCICFSSYLDMPEVIRNKFKFY